MTQYHYLKEEQEYLLGKLYNCDNDKDFNYYEKALERVNSQLEKLGE